MTKLAQQIKPLATRTATLGRNARQAFGLSNHDSVPVQIVWGSDRAPQLLGRSYHWTTPSGRTEVYHPHAYGWRVLYHPSTRRIVVGDRWQAAC
jgi:hypothetical protein